MFYFDGWYAWQNYFANLRRRGKQQAFSNQHDSQRSTANTIATCPEVWKVKKHPDHTQPQSISPRRVPSMVISQALWQAGCSVATRTIHRSYVTWRKISGITRIPLNPIKSYSIPWHLVDPKMFHIITNSDIYIYVCVFKKAVLNHLFF